ncbi:hypothetical protein FHU14_000572 [Mesorhizobium sp. RMAD-H1]|nr:hypothetical protein [Mesorhizobium sp. RMAD-H1]
MAFQKKSKLLFSLGAPLWPAGHLPRKGGDYAFMDVRHQSQASQNKGLSLMPANLPPCGGDARQGRGGRCPASV